VDIFADVLMDVVDGTKSRKTLSSLEFLHFVNPRSINWHDLAPSVAKLLGDDVQIVSFADWLEEVSSSIDQDDSGERPDLPAAKLVDFWQEMAKCDSERPLFSMDESLKVSEKLHGLESVSLEWMERWCLQWSEHLVSTCFSFWTGSGVKRGRHVVSRQWILMISSRLS